MGDSGANPGNPVAPPAMQVGFSHSKDQLGNAWLTINVALGIMAVQFSVPANSTDQFADTIKAEGKKARRIATGLVLPSEVPVQPNINGAVNGNVAH